MREIKFRAWDCVDEVMFYSMDDDFTLVRSDRKDKKYGVAMKGSLSVIAKCYPPLMQFTGICDTSGREIYEGDIIKRVAKRSCCGAVEYTIEGVVEWFCEGWVVRENGADIGDCAWANQKNETMEVIGNIYENPELIK